MPTLNSLVSCSSKAAQKKKYMLRLGAPRLAPARPLAPTLRRRLAPALSRALCSEPLHAVLRTHELAPEDAKGPLPEPSVLQARLDYLRSIGVPSVASAVRKHPPLLHLEVDAMKPRLEYLLSLGIHEVGPMVERVPELLNCDVKRDLQRKVVILQTLGLTKVARWVAKNPELVHVDLEEEMRPVVLLLRSVPGLQLPRVLPVLSWRHYRDAARLQAQLDFLGELLGPEQLGAALSRRPKLLTISQKTVQVKARKSQAAPAPAAPAAPALPRPRAPSPPSTSAAGPSSTSAAAREAKRRA